MENQSKVIVIERNKFAALVKSHRKCIRMLDILTYIYTVKQKPDLDFAKSVKFTVDSRRSGDTAAGIYPLHNAQKSMTVYEITDLLRLKNMLEMGNVYRKIDAKAMNIAPLNNE